MAAHAHQPSKRRSAASGKLPDPKPAKAAVRSRAVSAKVEAPAKKAVAKKPKRIRAEFAMPAADFERIAQLKEVARRAGFAVKKNELLRMGLQALQALSSADLHDRIRALRLPEQPAKP